MPPPIASMIVGAQKAGTTSLLRYLAQHPELCGHRTIECAYFADDVEWRRGWPAAHARYFYGCSGRLLVGKSANASEEALALERLASHNPDCAVIMIVRDPVERAFSSYRMERNAGWVDKPFEHILTVLDDEADHWHRLFVRGGNYAAALGRLHRVFDPSKVVVFVYEEFTENPVDTCRSAFRHIGVDDSFTPDTRIVHMAHREVVSQSAAAALRWLRKSGNPVRRLAKRALPPRAFDRVGHSLIEANHGLYFEEQMSSEVRERLGRYYRDQNAELESLLGRDLSHWSGMRAVVD